MGFKIKLGILVWTFQGGSWIYECETRDILRIYI